MELKTLLPELLNQTAGTLYMTVLSALFSYLIGVPLGIILYITSKKTIAYNRTINFVVGSIVNLIRSVPFIILLVVIIPFTRFIVGTSIGTTASIVPLVISASPLVARMVEGSLKEVDEGVIEAAQSMGSSLCHIIFRVILPEAKPSLIVGATITITTILGYSTMAGFVGGGGLGAMAINYGYYRYDTRTMIITLVLLVVIVQLFQFIGTKLAEKLDKRIRH